MNVHHLPPEITQYLGPAFTPVVEILWTVVGEPILLTAYVVCFMPHHFSKLEMKGVEEAFGALIAALVAVAVGLVTLLAVSLVVGSGIAYTMHRFMERRITNRG